MGWLVNHINNRDLAVENIVTALVRQNFLLTAHHEDLTGLHEKLSKLNIKLPTRSLLIMPEEILHYKDGLGGEYKVIPTRNARRESKINLTSGVLSSELLTEVRKIIRHYNLRGLDLENAVCLGGCVRINNRPFNVGDYLEYVQPIPLDSSTSSHLPSYRHIGKIKSMVLLGDVVLVFIEKIPISNYHDGMHVSLDQVNTFGGPTTTVIHVDSITFKLHRAPYPFIQDPPRFCYLRIWEVR